MPVKINSVNNIKARLGLDPDGEVQKAFTNTCYKAMSKYVPKDEGILRGTVDIKADSITYQTPYASYQYYGVRQDGSRPVKNYTTSGTGPYWDKVMWTAKGQDIVKQMQDLVNRGGK